MNWGPKFGVAMVSVFGLLVIWSVIWKGLALWRSARKGHKGWFVVLLIVNTVGILEIVYLLTSGKKENLIPGSQTPPQM